MVLLYVCFPVLFVCARLSRTIIPSRRTLLAGLVFLGLVVVCPPLPCASDVDCRVTVTASQSMSTSQLESPPSTDRFQSEIFLRYFLNFFFTTGQYFRFVVVVVVVVVICYLKVDIMRWK